MPTKKQLAMAVGFRKYYPVRHFSSKSQAARARHLIIRKRKSIGYTDIKILKERDAYALLARTKIQRKMGANVLSERKRKYGGF